MTQPRRGLGRGLDALFGGGAAAPAAPPPAPAAPPDAPGGSQADAPPESRPTPSTYSRISEPAPAGAAFQPPPAPQPEAAPAAAEPAPAPSRRGQPEYVDIDFIAPNPDQPRTHFEPERLRELADSIREHGIIQPLVVSRDASGAYRLIAGERRLQAARLAGLESVPVVHREAEDDELLELALVENIQRADLNPIEEAMAYRRLTEEHALTQEEAARRVGKSRAAVANSLRLLNLEPEIRRSLVAGEISEGHARALLGLPDPRSRMNAWREVLKRHLSVRDTEAHVRRALAEAPATATAAGAQTARRDAVIADIEAQLQRALSTRVSVLPQKRGARILIECYSAEEFDGVVSRILDAEPGDDR